MKKWIMFVLFSILLSCPALSGAADDIFDPGKGTLFSYPFFKIPFGEDQDSNVAREKTGDGEVRNDPKKEKEIRDKKVDDAIKKAWEEK
ncbi:MAG: hypothetical protein ABSG91_06840 [Syntrophobacteraceae bacterium]|jgi:hypothetical protein